MFKVSASREDWIEDALRQLREVRASSVNKVIAFAANSAICLIVELRVENFKLKQLLDKMLHVCIDAPASEGYEPAKEEQELKEEALLLFRVVEGDEAEAKEPPSEA